MASCRAKANPFTRPSILFRPHDPQTKDVGGAAGYRPRVRAAYYERVYRHSPCEHFTGNGIDQRLQALQLRKEIQHSCTTGSDLATAITEEVT